MKNRFAVIGAAALLMISGCVYTDTVEKVDKEEEKEIENDFKEFEEMFADSMGEVDWAVELFGRYEEGKGKKLKIYYVTQVGVKPPLFSFKVNKRELMHFSYSRYLENQLRDNFKFTGTSVKFVFREKGENELE